VASIPAGSQSLIKELDIFETPETPVMADYGLGDSNTFKLIYSKIFLSFSFCFGIKEFYSRPESTAFFCKFEMKN